MTITQTNYAGSHRYWRVYFQSGTVSMGVFIDNAKFVNPGLTQEFSETSPYTEDQLKNIKYSQDKNTMFTLYQSTNIIKNTGNILSNADKYVKDTKNILNNLIRRGIDNKIILIIIIILLTIINLLLFYYKMKKKFMY